MGRVPGFLGKDVLRGLILAVAVLALARPTTSHAYGAWEVGRAKAVANAAWPDSPCAKTTTTVIEAPSGARAADGEDSGRFYAWVQWDALGALSEGCTVHLSVRLRDEPWSVVCTVMIHEYGHLAGHDHEAAGIMSAAYAQHETDPRCADRGRPFLGMRTSRAYRAVKAFVFDI